MSGQPRSIVDLVFAEFVSGEGRAAGAKITRVVVTTKAIASSPMSSPITTEQRRALQPSEPGAPKGIRIETLIADEQLELEMHPDDWIDVARYKDPQGRHPVEARDGRYYLFGVPVEMP